MNRTDLSTAGVAGLIAALALALEHAALWRYQDVMTGYRRPVAYILGTGTLLIAFWGWALARRQVPAAVALTVIVALGGAGDVAAYGVRWVQEQADRAAYGPPRHS